MAEPGGSDGPRFRLADARGVPARVVHDDRRADGRPAALVVRYEQAPAVWAEVGWFAPRAPTDPPLTRADLSRRIGVDGAGVWTATKATVDGRRVTAQTLAHDAATLTYATLEAGTVFVAARGWSGSLDVRSGDAREAPAPTSPPPGAHVTFANDQFLRGVVLDRARIPGGDAAGYPWSLPVVAGLDVLEFPSPVTLLVGENGSGKSTLMEAIAVALGLNPESGTPNFGFATRASHSPLHAALRLARSGDRPRTAFFLRAESLYGLATEIERLDEEPGGPPIIDSYGGVSLHEQSHGESFLAVAVNRFGNDGLYLMDEPESALSPQGLLGLMRRIGELVRGGSQLIIATHSPILLAYPGATIYAIDEDGIHPTAYRDTGHYRLTRAFLEDPDRFLGPLLADD